jgi:hypothetical protein
MPEKILDFLQRFVSDYRVDHDRVDDYLSDDGRRRLLDDSDLTDVQKDILLNGSLTRIHHAILAEQGEPYREVSSYVPNILIVVLSKHT